LRAALRASYDPRLMFDFAWSEIALIAVVALVVIGPKDLPRAMRVAGMWVRKARAVAREFQSSVEEMVREAELEEVRREVENATRFDVAHEIKRHIDPGGEIEAALDDSTLKNPLVEAPPASASAGAMAEPPPAPAAASEPPQAPADAPASADPAPQR
jgi:sec-independent protein translocase protein TatB